MAPLQCVLCERAVASAYCVETKQVLCRSCVGRSTHPGTKANRWTFEKLRDGHHELHEKVILVGNVSLVIFLVAALVNQGIDDGYFRGKGTCPAVGVGRRAVARFDVNAFYYFKNNLATLCDMEDSFWRLFLDGWIRGIVAGTDSLLLLGATIMKAWIFKTAALTVVLPIFGAFYVIYSEAINFVLENSLAINDFVLSLPKKISEFVLKRISTADQTWRTTDSSSSGQPGTTGGLPVEEVEVGQIFRQALWEQIKAGSSRMQSLWKLPTKVKETLKTKRNCFERLKILFWALAFSVLVRLLVHLAGWERLAVTRDRDVGIWQLMAEPVLFYIIGLQMGNLQTKLDKTIWKKAPPKPVIPLTEWRQRPMKDVQELFQYARERYTRKWAFYKAKANSVLHILFDDLFNMVVVLRLCIIVFSIGPLVRAALAAVGLGSLIQRHGEWFTASTGVEIDKGTYVTDMLMAMVFSQSKSFGQIVAREAQGKIVEETEPSARFVMLITWRVVIPIIMYYLKGWWNELIKGQRARFDQEWQGTGSWANSQYAEQMESFGSYWNPVLRDQWDPLRDPLGGTVEVEEEPRCLQDITPMLYRRGEEIYVSMSELTGGAMELTAETLCQLHVLSDSSGLGAVEVMGS